MAHQDFVLNTARLIMRHTFSTPKDAILKLSARSLQSWLNRGGMLDGAPRCCLEAAQWGLLENTWGGFDSMIGTLVADA